MTLPAKREDDLIVVGVAEETLVYDLQRHEAHCLNRTAALVWQQCDGVTAASEIAAKVQAEGVGPVDEAVVGYALERLERARLLRESAAESERGRHSRREVLRRLSLAGAVAVLLPTVTSIVAPKAVQAATCVANCVGQVNYTPCNPPACGGYCYYGYCLPYQGA